MNRGLAWLALFAVIGVAAWGWVLNVIALATATGITGLVLLRAIGIFVAPLGAILGFI